MKENGKFQDITVLLNYEQRFTIQGLNYDTIFRHLTQRGHPIGRLYPCYNNPTAEFVQTEFQISCHVGDTAEVKMLINHPLAYPKILDEDKQYSLSPLRVAAREGTADVVKMLLDAGRFNPCAPPDMLTSYCPLYVAIENNNLDVVDLLLKDGRIDPRPRLYLDFLVEKRMFPIFELFIIDKRALPVWTDYPCVDEYNRMYDAKFCELLLKDGRVDPGMYNNAGIKNACRYRKTSIVQLLLADDRVDPTVNDNEPIRQACRAHHDAIIVKLLMSHTKVDPSANDNECYKKATERGLSEIVEQLLQDKRVSDWVNNQ